MNVFYNIGASVLGLFKDVNFMAFVENLKYMGSGMLGIFVVIGVIILAVILLSKISKDKVEK